MRLVTGIRWCWLLLALVLFALDISSKQWVINNLSVGESVSLMPFINCFYTHNPGVAFSLLASQCGSLLRWTLSGINVVIILILIWIMSYQYDDWYHAAYAIMIGGALGNLFDRIIHRVVIDFIDVYFGNWHLPTFNIADFSISLGALLITIRIMNN